MKRFLLLGYQWLTGVSDTATGVLLWVAPMFTLKLMGVRALDENAPYLSYIGAFVLAVGLSCLYGAYVIANGSRLERLEVVWLLTALSRASVAIYVGKSVLTGTLQPAWLSVAVFDGSCALIQFVGLQRKWIADAN
jgi:ABC-type transport system involved in cytochrome c biogenesis permease subunit